MNKFILTAIKPAIYQHIHLPLINDKGLEVIVKRLDLLHTEVQGNKFYKLHYNLEVAKKSGLSKVLTFGGAYSNHIHATALAASANGLKAIGIIRGEMVTPLNPTLEDARNQGMELYPMSREEYRQKDSSFQLKRLKERFGDFYLIPEGGTNAMAIKGTKEILEGKDLTMDFVTCPIGTGGTFAGLLARAESDQQLIGFSSLKGNFIVSEVDQLLRKYGIQPKCSYEIQTAYHFGGYAKQKPNLISFIQEIKTKANLPLEPVYTGKMVFGLFDLIEKDYFPRGSKILVLHTGGLQGIRGFEQRLGIKL
ncbi:putative D-cysteine desulfhydrase (DcyD) [Cyclobacterium marinum DSM 745]|uniref:Putative D-cysteine desulfhydrase (DcyD) n=1 Tax=Cyclobacterium marinum (strain ATCC 25205 / DSM 745 / LMG 13164 / NCIMB 1802) TaxID=880070 RepID=G0IUP9_CYCMS|nr:putative D-cysteine desulfhydrase (DcyD) [Cyclobacterium marinum DSM 745]